jgi:hypothetical protein
MLRRKNFPQTRSDESAFAAQEHLHAVALPGPAPAPATRFAAIRENEMSANEVEAVAPKQAQRSPDRLTSPSGQMLRRGKRRQLDDAILCGLTFVPLLTFLLTLCASNLTRHLRVKGNRTLGRIHATSGLPPRAFSKKAAGLGFSLRPVGLTWNTASRCRNGC